MPRTTTNPKNYIVSCRINDKEMRLLQKLARESNTSISSLVRHSLNLLDENAARA